MPILAAFLAGFLCGHRLGAFSLVVLGATTFLLALGTALFGLHPLAILAGILTAQLGVGVGLWTRSFSTID